MRGHLRIGSILFTAWTAGLGGPSLASLSPNSGVFVTGFDSIIPVSTETSAATAEVASVQATETISTTPGAQVINEHELPANMQRLVADFRRKANELAPGLAFQMECGATGPCWTGSHILVEKVIATGEYGVRGEIYIIDLNHPNLVNVNPFPEFYTPEVTPWHAIVKLDNGMFVDVTARQFNPTAPYPMVFTVSGR